MSESLPGDAGAPSAPSSGDQVDSTLERLAELDARPPTEHAEVYEAIHQRLADTLRRPDER